jgi:dsRNA-specific ribonuclease
MKKKQPLCLLNEWAQANGKQYSFTDTSTGPAHKPDFTSRLKFERCSDVFVGTGPTKKQARSSAAQAAVHNWGIADKRTKAPVLAVSA